MLSFWFRSVPALVMFVWSTILAKLQSVEPLCRELDFEPSSSGFLISGVFKRANKPNEFWLCFDYPYKPDQFNNSIFNKPYPRQACGGAPQESISSLYWFALRGRLLMNASMSIQLVNTANDADHVWSWTAGKVLAWELAVETQKNSPNIVYFNGLSDLEIPPVAPAGHIHLRMSTGVHVTSVLPQLNPVILDRLPKYHLLSRILSGDETVLKAAE